MHRLLVLIAAVVQASAVTAGDPPPPPTVSVPAGPFIAGSGLAEREQAFRLDEQAYGHSVTRQQRWYEAERARQTIELPAFEITATLVTNADYARFVAATGHLVPDVDRATWEDYGLVHPFERTRRHAWTDIAPPAGRADHPVVLVSHADAEAYAAWLSEVTGESWRLPTELEWEKAARGTDGRWFPWTGDWDPTKANTHDLGPFDTTPVGSYPDGASPFGILNAAGQVFEWTATAAGPGRFIVKGGSWEDRGCGVCRPAARHARPADLKHILIGFRLVRGGVADGDRTLVHLAKADIAERLIERLVGGRHERDGAEQSGRAAAACRSADPGAGTGADPGQDPRLRGVPDRPARGRRRSEGAEAADRAGS